MYGWEEWKKGFDAWESATAQYMEQWLRSPMTLGPMGAMLSAAMRTKAAGDAALEAFWASWRLPTRTDQERTLHALNQLQSKLFDLEERLAEMEERQRRG